MSKIKNVQAAIDERLSQALKVSDLVEFLKTVPQDAVVGAVGRFKNLVECSKKDVRLEEAYVTADYNWRSKDGKMVPVVVIDIFNFE